MNVLELFSGSGTISKKFREKGHKTFEIDIRKRKGICEPDLRKNILQVRIKDIPFKKVHVIWASPPCDVFSKAGVRFHWDSRGNPKTEKCREHLKILKKSLVLIEKLKPDVFFIENPDGRMKYQKDLVNFLIRNNAMTKKVYFGCYGFGTLKPTTIFTNAIDWNPKNTAHDFEKNRVIFDNLTKCKKQTIPVKFAEEIVEYFENKKNIKLDIFSKLRGFIK